jgi:hypothetical protein
MRHRERHRDAEELTAGPGLLVPGIDQAASADQSLHPHDLAHHLAALRERLRRVVVAEQQPLGGDLDAVAAEARGVALGIVLADGPGAGLVRPVGALRPGILQGGVPRRAVAGGDARLPQPLPLRGPDPVLSRLNHLNELS